VPEARWKLAGGESHRIKRQNKTRPDRGGGEAFSQLSKQLLAIIFFRRPAGAEVLCVDSIPLVGTTG
jgi:hypothetical protein